MNEGIDSVIAAYEDRLARCKDTIGLLEVAGRDDVSILSSVGHRLLLGILMEMRDDADLEKVVSLQFMIPRIVLHLESFDAVRPRRAVLSESESDGDGAESDVISVNSIGMLDLNRQGDYQWVPEDDDVQL